MKIIYTDEFMQIVPQAQSKYKIVLQGSYEYSGFKQRYAYDIAEITPKCEITKLYSHENLFLTDDLALSLKLLFEMDGYFRLKFDAKFRESPLHQRPFMIQSKEYLPYFEYFEKMILIEPKKVNLSNLAFILELFFSVEGATSYYVLYAFELFLTHKQNTRTNETKN